MFLLRLVLLSDPGLEGEEYEPYMCRVRPLPEYLVPLNSVAASSFCSDVMDFTSSVNILLYKI